MQEIWIQADEDFITSYKHWKDSRPQLDSERRIKTPSPYAHKGPYTNGQILKSQIINQSSLTPIGPGSFRLEGDFFKYLTDLEKSFVETQTQLDLAIVNLKEEQLSVLRENNRARTVKDTLQAQMTSLVEDYRKAESKHLENLKVLGDTLQGVREELAKVTNHALQLEARLAAGGKNVGQNEKAKSDSEVVKDNLALQKEILKVRKENQILKERNDSLVIATQTVEKENLVLLETIHEYESQIKDAKETENAYREQSIAIEKLRDALESGELDNDNGPVKENGSKLRSKSSQSVLRRLPSKDLRLNRTEEGWEWTPWIERTAIKAIHIDFNGLKDEFQNLKAHREEAFIRARNSGLDIVMQVASFFPFASSLFFEPVEPWDSPDEGHRDSWDATPEE